MKLQLTPIVIAAALSIVAPAAADEVAGDPSRSTVADAMTTLEVPFIGNRGEIDHPGVRFYARTFAGTVFVTDAGELVYSLPLAQAGAAPARWAFREAFRGAADARIAGVDASSIRIHRFTGGVTGGPRSRLPAYDAVDLGELYRGVRVRLRATGNNVEKLFHVAPGADVGAIDIAVEGVDGAAVDARGRLVLDTSLGDIVMTAPEAFQIVDGRRRPVEVAYRLGDGLRYGFTVGAYDRDRELVIDPMLAATYLGGHNPNPPGNYDDDVISGMVLSNGDIWVAGVTQSPDFPIVLGYDDTLPNAYPDGFITRISDDLTTVLASTYLGTDGFDRVTDIALDSDGTIIAVGEGGWGFPVTPGAYNWSGTTPSGGGFVVRMSADLSTLLGSALPAPGDYPRTVTLGNGGIYFGGSTNNPSFPITPGAFLSTCCAVGGFGIREYNGFAGKLSSDLTTLEAMTYLSGRTASAMAVGPDGSVYITDGFDYAVTGTIARFSEGLTSRSALLSYYPGSTSGSSRTYFNDVATGDGFVVAVGQTYMNDLPATPGAFDTTCGTDGLCDGVGPLLVPRSDGFVAIYSPDLQSTTALTYLGGSDHESVRSVAIAADGGIIVTGETESVDFPTGGPGADTTCGTDGQCNAGGAISDAPDDGFVVRLSSDLSTLDYGSYVGGSGIDLPNVVAVDPRGVVSIGGRTDSADFPATAGAFDTSYNGGTADAFIARFDTGVATGGLIFADDFETGDMNAWTVN